MRLSCPLLVNVGMMEAPHSVQTLEVVGAPRWCLCLWWLKIGNDNFQSNASMNYKAQLHLPPQGLQRSSLQRMISRVGCKSRFIIQHTGRKKMKKIPKGRVSKMEEKKKNHRKEVEERGELQKAATSDRVKPDASRGSSKDTTSTNPEALQLLIHPPTNLSNKAEFFVFVVICCLSTTKSAFSKRITDNRVAPLHMLTLTCNDL